MRTEVGITDGAPGRRAVVVEARTHTMRVAASSTTSNASATTGAAIATNVIAENPTGFVIADDTFERRLRGTFSLGTLLPFVKYHRDHVKARWFMPTSAASSLANRPLSFH